MVEDYPLNYNIFLQSERMCYPNKIISPCLIHISYLNNYVNEKLKKRFYKIKHEIISIELDKPC